MEAFDGRDHLYRRTDCRGDGGLEPVGSQIGVNEMAQATSVNIGSHSAGSAFESASYVEWPCIIAGAMAALAVSFVLLTFGSAIGLASVSPWTSTSGSVTAVTIGAGFWLLLVHVWAFALGGYISARMRHRRAGASENEVAFRDGAHGLLVWSTAVVLGAIVAVSAAASAGRGVASAASSLTSVATDALLRSGKGAPDGRSDEVRAELGRLLATMSGRGNVVATDRTYLAEVVAARTGLPQAEAEKRVETVITQLKDGANKARKAAVVVGFLAAATLLLAGAAAWWGATVGGRHRDEGEVWAGFARANRT